MQKEDIRIRHVIVHILDSSVGLPVLSPDREAEFGSDFAEFLRDHIFQSCGRRRQQARTVRFIRSSRKFTVLLTTYEDRDFVAFSKQAAELLYGIMNSNIEIPPADLIVVRFREKEKEYLALLKMNFRDSYTHRTLPLEDGNCNEIIRYKAITRLPAPSVCRKRQ